MYESGSVGKCPHCGRETKFVGIDGITLGYDLEVYVDRRSTDHVPMSHQQPWTSGLTVGTPKDFLFLNGSKCFICDKMVIGARSRPLGPDDAEWDLRIWPRGGERPVSDLVPETISAVFKRASRLLGVDDTASAAFARTCLEKVLDEHNIPRDRTTRKGKTLQRSLEERLRMFTGVLELPDGVNTPDLPNDVSDDIDTIRQMGNFIHLNESIATGDVVDLSPEDAAFALDLLEELFDTLYVAPAQRAARRATFDAKLASIGKDRNRIDSEDGSSVD